MKPVDLYSLPHKDGASSFSYGFAVVLLYFPAQQENHPTEADPAFSLALPSWLTLCPKTKVVLAGSKAGCLVPGTMYGAAAPRRVKVALTASPREESLSLSQFPLPLG